MTDQKSLLKLFKETTGKTTHIPKSEPSNPVGWQESKVKEYQIYE